MPHPDLDRVVAWLRDHEQDLLDDYRAMLRIPSVESAPEPGAPFGPENRRALDLALSLCSGWGMRTKDLEGFAGWAEFGEGERLVVSLGHLDVVPVGPGWKHEPFGAEIDGGYVYARGAVDDKGPTMAATYAARAIQACCPDLNARIRLVFGCNEESGFKCVERYMQTEEAPTFGVAPDSGWPLYHAEKGIANITVRVAPPTGAFALTHVEGGQRPNIVIDRCEARVSVDSGVRAEVESRLADAWDRNVAFSWDGDTLCVEAIGKAAHGAFPFGGDSAAIRAFRFLASIAPLDDQPFYAELFEQGQIGGAGLGISVSDSVSKDLTCNLGLVGMRDGEVELLYNIRYPVKFSGEQIREMCEGTLAETKSGFRMVKFTDSAPLYFPLDHPLVRTIVEVCEEELGEGQKPGTMGGGTYARAVPNTVSIGTGWEGDGPAHENDERLKLDHLYRMSRIYAHILLRLATL